MKFQSRPAEIAIVDAVFFDGNNPFEVGELLAIPEVSELTVPPTYSELNVPMGYAETGEFDPETGEPIPGEQLWMTVRQYDYVVVHADGLVQCLPEQEFLAAYEPLIGVPQP